MEQEYNIGDLWEWARSGRLTPFTLQKNGEPACWIIRVNGDGMDWLYAQYEDDKGSFTVPYEPFGMWGWPERMCCIRDEYAGLGNWSLPEAEQRLSDAYVAEAVLEIQREADQLMAENADLTSQEIEAGEEMAAKLAERSVQPENWADAGLVVVTVPPYNLAALFRDEGGEIGRILQSINSDNPEIREAARLIAALQAAVRETAPAMEPEPEKKTEPKPAAEPASKPGATKSNPVPSSDGARDDILAAIGGQKLKKLVVYTADGKYTVRRVGLVKDLQKGETILAENVLEGEAANGIPAGAIDKITTLSGKEVLYNRA